MGGGEGRVSLGAAPLGDEWGNAADGGHALPVSVDGGVSAAMRWVLRAPV